MSDSADEYSVLDWLAVSEWLDALRSKGGISREGLMDVQLGEDDLVAVIGARVSNVGEELWNNPRCVFLQGDVVVSRGLPVNTRAVVFTRFLGHTAFKVIMDQVRRRKLAVYPMQGTGQLKRTLATLLAPVPVPVLPMTDHSAGRVLPEFSPPETREPETLPVPEPQTCTCDAVEPPGGWQGAVPLPCPVHEIREPEDDMAKTVQRGDVTAWVRDQYTPGMKFADIIRLATREKVPFKSSSISAAFYTIKREVGVAAKPAKPAPPPAETLDQRAVAIARDIVAVQAVPVPPPAPPVPAPNGDELVRLVDEVMAGLALVREAAVRMAADREKMAKILELAQQLGVS